MALAAASGCGDDVSGSGEGSESEASQSGTESATETGSESTEDSGSEGGPLVSVDLPQAIADAMYVNTTVYDEIPVHAAVEGDAEMVVISHEGNDYPATDDDDDGDWVALVPVSGTGMSDMTVTASAAGMSDVTDTAELVRGSDDIQVTDEDDVGPSTNPHVFTHEGRLFLTYTDRVDGARVLLQELDGAGRPVGDLIVLVPGSVGAVRARIAQNGDHIAVVYKTPTGTPYHSFFAVYDLTGAEVLAPMALEDATSFSDSFGGDLEWDGAAYQLVRRRNDGNGRSWIEWLRITEGGDVTGPVELAADTFGNADMPTDSDVLRDIPANTFLKLTVVGDTTAITWTRYRYLGLLGAEVLKGYVATLTSEGTVLGEDAFASPDDFLWTWSFHTYAVHGEAMAIANVDDLASPDVPAPTAFRGFAWDENDLQSPAIDAGALVYQAADTREEPFVVEHRSHHATLLWIDHIEKSVQNDIQAPIQLHVAPLSSELGLGEQTIFSQARFFAGAAQLRGTPVYTNLALTWTDARRGFPSSETYIDFAWY